MQSEVERITKIYQAEEADQPKALTRDDIPVRWEGVTEQWLTAVLCGDVPGAEVTSFRFSERDDGTSNRRRIYLEYNDIGSKNGLPATVFCKASMGLENRFTLGVMGCSHAESTFYTHARGLLDIEAPFAYIAAYDPESYAAIAVLEDLGEKVDFCDESTYYDRAMAQGQADLLAAMHGRLQGHPELGGSKLSFMTWPVWFNNLCRTVDMETYCKKGFLAAEKVIPPRLYARAEEVWPATLKSVERHHSLRPTLLHGDSHAKNWYRFKDDRRMGLGDWQAVIVGNWSRDYAYAIASSLDVEDRRNWERELLQRYLEGMKRAGAEAPTFDEGWELYRQQLFAGLAYWTITLTPAPGMPDMQPEKTTLKIIERLANAIDDLEALDIN